MTEINECSNWTEWRNLIEGRIDLFIKQKEEDIEKHTLINKGFLTIKKKYEIIKEIGSGSFGITYLVKYINLNKEFILKEFSSGMIDQKKNESFFIKFINEIQFLFDLHHQNIVSIYDYKIDIEKQVGYYIMEYIDGSDILKYIQKYKDKINDIFEQIIDVFFI